MWKNNRWVWLLLAVPVLAVAADETAQKLAYDGQTLAFWVLLAGTQVVVLVGHAASSLGAWAQWHDSSGSVQDARVRRYDLLQKLCVSLFAGNLVYLAGVYHLALDHVQAIISAGVASWGGDKFLAPLLGRVVAVFQPQQKG